MADGMISFDHEKGRFNFRVGGIALEGGSVLLTTDRGADYWYLPGGRVEMHETTEEALIREVREELQIEPEIERLVWIIENFFVWRGTPFHEVGFYYAMRLPTPLPGIPGAGRAERRVGKERLSFQWQPLAGLGGINVQPAVLQKRLLQIPEHVEHIVHSDPEGSGRP